MKKSPTKKVLVTVVSPKITSTRSPIYKLFFIVILTLPHPRVESMFPLLESGRSWDCNGNNAA